MTVQTQTAAPAGPATARQFRRVNPYPGLMVDAQIWEEAHEYHRDQLRLHHLALHGWGVIQGLEVTLVKGAENTVRIEPGLAIDSAGNFLVVPEGQVYRLMTRNRGVVYLVLQFREALVNGRAGGGADGQPTHILEIYRIEERDRLPNEPYIELARVDFDPGQGALAAARNAEKPGVNELDLRARVVVGAARSPVVFAPTAPAPPAALPQPEGAPAAQGTGERRAESAGPAVEELSRRLGEIEQQVDALSSLRQAVEGLAPLRAEVEGLAPLRSEVEQVAQLRSELVALGARVDELASRPAEPAESVPASGPAPVPAPASATPDPRVGPLVEQVDALSRRLDALASAPPAALEPVPAAPAEPSAEFVAASEALRARVDAVVGQVDGLAERVQAFEPTAAQAQSAQEISGTALEQAQTLARQVEELSQQIARQADQAGPTSTPELDALAQRVHALDQDVQTLSAQVQALARDAEARAQLAAPATAAPIAQVATGIPQTPLRVALVEHGGAGWDAHTAGLRFLAREVSAADGYVAGSETIVAAQAQTADVIYLSGHEALKLGDADVQGLTDVLARGGVVVGEGCAAGPGGEQGARDFAMSFWELAQRLGRQLVRVDRGHPLLTARHVFGAAPVGGRDTPRVMEAGGMIYSDADFGCAWQGGTAEHPLPRATIRDALEFGTNMVLYRKTGQP